VQVCNPLCRPRESNADVDLTREGRERWQQSEERFSRADSQPTWHSFPGMIAPMCGYRPTWPGLFSTVPNNLQTNFSAAHSHPLRPCLNPRARPFVPRRTLTGSEHQSESEPETQPLRLLSTIPDRLQADLSAANSTSVRSVLNPRARHYVPLTGVTRPEHRTESERQRAEEQEGILSATESYDSPEDEDTESGTDDDDSQEDEDTESMTDDYDSQEDEDTESGTDDDDEVHIRGGDGGNPNLQQEPDIPRQPASSDEPMSITEFDRRIGEWAHLEINAAC